MKLLFCNNCHDIFNLKREEVKYCSCKKSWGRYIDNLNAEYSGDCVMLGIDNPSFIRAIDLLKKYPDRAKGEEFTAWIITPLARTVKYIKE